MSFFKGWRRKLGGITLVIAVLLTVACFRSWISHDWVTVCIADEMYSVWSAESHIGWTEEFDPPPIGGPRIWWGTSAISQVVEPAIEVESGPNYALLHSSIRHSISYWTLISPLTLAAVCLLLPFRWPNKPHA